MSQPDLACRLVDEFEEGRLSRRQLVAGLMGLGAAAALSTTAVAADEAESTFRATGLDHINIDVADLERSKAFYIRHLGLKVLREGPGLAFLGPPGGGKFILALFRTDELPGLNHFCFKIENYDADAAVRKLQAAGLETRRESNRVYFKDPDGLDVELAGT